MSSAPRSALMPLDEALSTLLLQITPLTGSELVATFDADGRVLAEDVVSETLLAILERPEGFEGRSSLRTYATGILKFKVIDVLRKRGREVHIEPLDEQSIDDALDALFLQQQRFLVGNMRLQCRVLLLQILLQLLLLLLLRSGNNSHLPLTASHEQQANQPCE